MVRYFVVTLLLVYSLVGEVFAMKTNKILVVSSYGTDYQWSNSIIDGIHYNVTSKYPGIEFNVEYLSSELFVGTETWMLKMNTILSAYQESPPLAIVLISDEAWMAFSGLQTEKFKNTPLFLCAVKPHTISVNDYVLYKENLAMSQFKLTDNVMSQYNATGILRDMNIDGFIELMQRTIPNIDRFELVTDDRFYGVYTKLRFEQTIKEKYPTYNVNYISATNVNTDSMLRRLSQITPTTGLLFTSWLTGEHGFEYSKDYIYKRMISELKTPIFITNNIGLDKGYFLGGYFNNAEYWGDKTGDMIIAHLKGKNPKDIPVEIYKDEECYINWNVMNKYGLSEKNMPKNTVFYDRPESVFLEYGKLIVLVGVIAILIILSYAYVLNNNIKLHKAKDAAMRSMKDTEVANDKLRLAQRNLTIALQKAEESDQLKSAFIANMNHEIRTPLNAIVGFSDIIANTESGEERKEYSIIIKKNSKHLLQLISDILDISKLESGVTNFTYNDFDANMICLDVVNVNKDICNHNTKLFLNHSEEPLMLKSDVFRLTQVLSNLVNNAIKFTQDGTIEVGCFSYDEKYIQFYVKDTGIGMSEDNLKTIFDRFVKLNSYVEGTGLGLVVCRTIIKLLGGEIGVESKEGEGSNFWFRVGKEIM